MNAEGRSIGVRAGATLFVFFFILFSVIPMLAACSAPATPPAQPTTIIVIYVVEQPKTATPIPEIVLPFAGKKQLYPLSCEAAAAESIVTFSGGLLSERQILDQLPRSADPNEGFVGSPQAPVGSIYPAGYGVYAAPLSKLMQKNGIPAQTGLGKGLDWLRDQIRAGKPTVIWAVWRFQTAEPTGWKTKEGKTITAYRFEHTYIVYGWKPGQFLIWNTYPTDDPPAQPSSFWINENDLEKSWSLFNYMALWIEPQGATR
jgi:uncharacterized protein YvpB